jgi:spermidine/putrescine transport system permease protein
MGWGVGVVLHAGPLRSFTQVVWRLSLPGLWAGIWLSLIPAAGDVVNSRFLGGPNDRMIANAIENLLLGAVAGAAGGGPDPGADGP